MAVERVTKTSGLDRLGRRCTVGMAEQNADRGELAVAALGPEGELVDEGCGGLEVEVAFIVDHYPSGGGAAEAGDQDIDPPDQLAFADEDVILSVDGIRAGGSLA